MTVRVTVRASPKAWSADEHQSFLQGLEELGRGHWSALSKKFVPSRSAAQVASHAQKYFLRTEKSSRKSREPSEEPSLPHTPAVSADLKFGHAVDSARTVSVTSLNGSERSSEEEAEESGASPSSRLVVDAASPQPLFHRLAISYANIMAAAMERNSWQALTATEVEAVRALSGFRQIKGPSARRGQRS